jgi:heme-degrading monooxygenase HmoA
MGDAYSHSFWRVKPGQEDEFVRRWEELADWSALQGLKAHAKLLRDIDDPSRFVSFGPWESVEAIRGWRGAAGFHERVARLQEVVDGFDPRTLELVTER